MPHFFDLPRELRDAIYEIVLLTPLPTPSSPKECRSSPSYKYDLIGCTADSANMGYECVGYAPPQISSYALLLVSHQIRNEVHEILDSLHTRKQLVYKLDCMVETVGSGRLYVAPLSIPVISSQISKIEIDIRFLGEYKVARGCVAMWGFSLLSFVNRFLTRGPNLVLRHKESEQSRGIYVDTVTFNFLAVPEVPEWMTESACTWLAPPGEEKPKGREAGIRMVTRVVHNVIDPSPRMLIDNMVICERVNFVRLLDDGKTRKEWDVAAIRSRGAAGPEVLTFPT